METEAHSYEWETCLGEVVITDPSPKNLLVHHLGKLMNKFDKIPSLHTVVLFWFFYEGLKA